MPIDMNGKMTFWRVMVFMVGMIFLGHPGVVFGENNWDRPDDRTPTEEVKKESVTKNLGERAKQGAIEKATERILNEQAARGEEEDAYQAEQDAIAEVEKWWNKDMEKTAQAMEEQQAMDSQEASAKPANVGSAEDVGTKAQAAADTKMPSALASEEEEIDLETVEEENSDRVSAKKSEDEIKTTAILERLADGDDVTAQEEVMIRTPEKSIRASVEKGGTGTFKDGYGDDPDSDKIPNSKKTLETAIWNAADEYTKGIKGEKVVVETPTEYGKPGITYTRDENGKWRSEWGGYVSREDAQWDAAYEYTKDMPGEPVVVQTPMTEKNLEMTMYKNTNGKWTTEWGGYTSLEDPVPEPRMQDIYPDWYDAKKAGDVLDMQKRIAQPDFLMPKINPDGEYKLPVDSSSDPMIAEIQKRLMPVNDFMASKIDPEKAAYINPFDEQICPWALNYIAKDYGGSFFNPNSMSLSYFTYHPLDGSVVPADVATIAGLLNKGYQEVSAEGPAQPGDIEYVQLKQIGDGEWDHVQLMSWDGRYVSQDVQKKSTAEPGDVVRRFRKPRELWGK